MIFNNRKTRRQFLVGAGKTILALPFLPSLLPYKAFANTVTPPKRFVALTSHLGQREEWWRPFPFTTSPGLSVVRDGRSYNEISLTSLKSTGINHILTAAFAPYMDKMAFIHGLDISPNSGHNKGQVALGHISDSDPWETIDQVIARALYNRIYNTVPTLPIVLIDNGSGGTPSFRKNGTSLIKVPGTIQPRALVERLFRQHNPDTKQRYKKVMDQMSTAYHGLASNARLSKDDKTRVEAYADAFNDFENRLRLMAPLTPTCTNPNISQIDLKLMTQADMAIRHQLFNDAIVLSLSCGASLVVNANIANTHLSSQTIPHDWSHIDETNIGTSAGREAHRDTNKWIAEASVLDLVKKMDAMPDGSGTLLDNSLVYWGNEFSHGASHDQHNMPVVVFGSAGGKLRTGYLYNYEQQGTKILRYGLRAGRLYNQFLVTIMQAMGLTEDDYVRKNASGTVLRQGYGAYQSKNPERQSYYAAVESDHYLPLPGMLK